MARKFSITYFPYPIADLKTGKFLGNTFRPTVPIKISNGRKISPFTFQALVDSGADRNLFPAKFGEQIGLNVKKGNKNSVYGIGDIEIMTYTHEVTLHIEKCKFEVEVDFLTNLGELILRKRRRL